VPIPKAAGERPAGRASLIEKSFDILEAVVGRAQPSSLAQITTDVGLPKATVHRTIAALERAGLLMRVPGSRLYTAGDRMVDLALRGLCAADHQGACRRVLDDLAGTLGETAALGVVANGVLVGVLGSAVPPATQGLIAEPLGRAPLHCSSGGKVLLAHMPPGQRALYLAASGLPRLTPRTITDRAALEAALGRIRERGFASDDEECQEGVVCVAAPVRDRQERVVAALYVVAVAARTPLARLIARIDAVERAARRISRVLAGGAATPCERTGDPRPADLAV